MSSTKKVEIIDNFLPLDTFKSIQEKIFAQEWPWYFVDGVDYDMAEEKENLQKYQFGYLFYIHSQPVNSGFSVIGPIVQSLNTSAIVRIKANLLLRTEKTVVNEFHSDTVCNITGEQHKNVTTAIYYLNSNDGYTLFEDGSKVESIENRMIKFPSEMLHCGTTCTNAKRRVVINFNYYAKEFRS